MTPAPAPLLRPTRWQELRRLADLETELFGAQAWSERTWWSELAARPRREYVTLVGASSVASTDDPTGRSGPVADDVLGYAGLDHGGEVADVMTIAVAPHGRRRGLGRMLLDWCIERAGASGAQHLMLEVAADNDAARRLYERAGFQQISVRRGYYHGVDALILRRPLEPGRST